MPEFWLLLLFVISVVVCWFAFFFSFGDLGAGLRFLLDSVGVWKWKFFASLAGRCSFKWLARGRPFLLGVKNLRIVRTRPP
ncbi:MAG: hypothetical protein PHZ04_01740 [Patescibacteria group bacterium]|nr:hypothetical protein [Patescibacteria group bacterium]MDD5294943.1 hypothetical protein [Patescibacteria group bacterium]MDD5554787.1 hypothetical protein [Patescibacteria group bacterium]